MAYNLLKGKKGIIFGALNEQSIAWKVAQHAVQEGAEIVLSNAPIALRMGELNKLAEECNAPVVGADVTKLHPGTVESHERERVHVQAQLVRRWLLSRVIEHHVGNSDAADQEADRGDGSEKNREARRACLRRRQQGARVRDRVRKTCG